MLFVSQFVLFKSFCFECMVFKFKMRYKGGGERKNSMNKTSDTILQRLMQLLKTEDYDDQQLEIVEYGLRCLIGEVTKITILLSVFWMVDLLKEFLFAIVPLILLRTFIGGTHRETEKGCLIQSFVMFTTILFCGKNIYIYFLISCGLYIFFAIGTFMWTPVFSEKRVKYTKQQCKRFRLRAVLVLMLLFLVAHFFPIYYGNFITWAVIIQFSDTFVARKLTERRGLDENIKAANK